ncbi:LLM class flavin-dependent oxidoreductase [Pseudonocardia sp. S2-4]|uniref:LLM class flavin-dependent oxidoreductase n=2 Tax=Pseudonocardia humida TaxID=2800819 RepID=A0ABT0ZZL4_9PSEU|nr:LLM class flavin-dependent oxidoreductase [Pseudonocardia humida]
MPDLGHDLAFGTFITPAADRAEQALALAELTEQVGLDLVSVQDHPYQPAHLDAWTLLSVIAARTRSVAVLPNVANLPLRPPAVLARSAASLDILSGGRVELGLGAGAFWDAIAAQGGPRRTPGESLTALAEAIGVIRALWTPGRGARTAGEHYRLAGAKPGPFPVHDIGIWLGVYKPRGLRLTGRAADGWLPSSPYLPPEQLAAAGAVIDEAARAAGREPSAVRRLYNVVGTFEGTGREFLQGPPEVWVEQLAELALTEGVSGFILMADSPDLIRRYAAEVAPAVRELVAAERAGAAGPAAPLHVPEPVTARGSLAGVPTPDDGTRLSTEHVWDESTRPTGPASDPRRDYTPHEVAAGRHLVDVHDGLRAELRQLRDIADQVAAGALDPGTARSHLQTMTLRQNNWTLGVYCETYCRIVTTHHTIEDRTLFPHLRRAEPALAPVVDRLAEEHIAIHGVIERVDQALVALVTTPDGMKDLRAAIDLLTDTLLSHLSYEERELVEPLARLGFG